MLGKLLEWANEKPGERGFGYFPDPSTASILLTLVDTKVRENGLTGESGRELKMRISYCVLDDDEYVATVISDAIKEISPN